MEAAAAPRRSPRKSPRKAAAEAGDNPEPAAKRTKPSSGEEDDAAALAAVLGLLGAPAAEPEPQRAKAEKYLGRVKKELDAHEIEWCWHEHGQAKHGFVMPDNNGAVTEMVGYSEAADRRSTAAMKEFFTELFPMLPPDAGHVFLECPKCSRNDFVLPLLQYRRLRSFPWSCENLLRLSPSAFGQGGACMSLVDP